MQKRILITGGAGFVGSHVADEMLSHGYEVRALDNLSTQVHGPGKRRPAYLNGDVELLTGDVRDGDMVREALKGVDAVFHFAARVGVGQSMYEVSEYTSVNNVGTAVLLECLARHPVERLVVASSMSVYGEGLYRAADGTFLNNAERSLPQLRMNEWELRGADGEILKPIATPETKPPNLSSVYALSKYDQEQMCLLLGRAYDFSAVALRFFNIYGPRQALSNPYTGVLAIFASRLLNHKPPLIFEDGRQKRDFVSIHDVKRACRLALETPAARGGVFNIGSGQSHTIEEIAREMAAVLDCEDLDPEITGRYRGGDIRHCFADISCARKVLGYQPRVSLEEGIAELAQWLEGKVAVDRVAQACSELSDRGLTV